MSQPVPQERQLLSVVSPRRRRLRRLGAAMASALLPCRVVDAQGGLDRAAGLVAKGYALIVIMNHFSFRDAPQALALLCSSAQLRQGRILAPVALHQYRRYGAPVRACTALFAIELCPVVTPYTDQQFAGGGDLHQSLKAYAAGATSVLQARGIVLLAPQGRSEPQLGNPAGRPVFQLLRRLPHAGDARVALMFLGLGIPGEEDYSRGNAGGLNLRRQYEARIGATVTVGEVLKQMPNLRAVDGWIFDCLRALVPPAYLGQTGRLWQPPERARAVSGAPEGPSVA